ncbi:MAG: hypothetical protein V3S58_06015, partial [Nitrosomonadaceae bacterium]
LSIELTLSHVAEVLHTPTSTLILAQKKISRRKSANDHFRSKADIQKINLYSSGYFLLGYSTNVQ